MRSCSCSPRRPPRCARAGLRLGALQSVSIEPTGGPVAADGTPPQGPAAAGPLIKPGQLSVVARVRLVYQLQ
jgi:hypothetical protein